MVISHICWLSRWKATSYLKNFTLTYIENLVIRLVSFCRWARWDLKNERNSFKMTQSVKIEFCQPTATQCSFCFTWLSLKRYFALNCGHVSLFKTPIISLLIHTNRTKFLAQIDLIIMDDPVTGLTDISFGKSIFQGLLPRVRVVSCFCGGHVERSGWQIIIYCIRTT